MELHIGDKVFYTRSTGVRVPATVVGAPRGGFVELEYYQDAVRVVNRLYCIPGVRRIGDLVHGALRTTNCLIKRLLGDARVKGVPGAVAAIKKVLSDIASDAAHIRSDVRF